MHIIGFIARNWFMEYKKCYFYEKYVLWLQIFIKCPDISNWDITKVKDMNFMFFNCEKLISLPDISKWDVSNVSSMSKMFENCSSLESFPNLSKWKTKKELEKIDMFRGCNKKIIPKKFKGCFIFWVIINFNYSKFIYWTFLW